MNNYFETLYSNRVKNTEEMDRFLETYELPKLIEEGIAILNNPISAIAIENIFENFPTKKIPGFDGFTEFYKNFRQDLMLIPL